MEPETKNPEPQAILEGFDLETFAVTGNVDNIILRKVLIQVPVRKPNKQKFFRVVPGAEWNVAVNVLEIKEEGNYYLIMPSVLPYIAQEVKLVRLYLGYYLDGNPFIIPVPLPDSNGKINNWHSSLDLVVKSAMKKWVRAIPDQSIQGYDLMEAAGNIVCMHDLPSDKVLNDYVGIAFKGKIIDSLEHPVVKVLLGQMTVVG